jgi:shikimate kinase
MEMVAGEVSIPVAVAFRLAGAGQVKDAADMPMVVVASRLGVGTTTAESVEVMTMEPVEGTKATMPAAVVVADTDLTVTSSRASPATPLVEVRGRVMITGKIHTAITIEVTTSTTIIDFHTEVTNRDGTLGEEGVL